VLKQCASHNLTNWLHCEQIPPVQASGTSFSTSVASSTIFILSFVGTCTLAYLSLADKDWQAKARVLATDEKSHV